jgi:DNA-binding MarR family transcriptional regulator
MSTNEIYDIVERLSELLRVDSRQSGAKYGLQPVQIEALHYLSVCNKYSDTPKAVTEYLGQTKGTVSQTLNVLEKKGLLGKQADVDDKRVFHLKLTKQGQGIIKKIIPTPMFENACKALTKQAQSEISTSLKQLLTTILQLNKMKTFGLCSTCYYNSRSKNNEYFCNLVEQPLSVIETELICREYRIKESEVL